MAVEHICLWCGGPEPSRYQPRVNTDFVCSSCVQTLLACNREELSELLESCRARKYESKIRALRSFIRF